MRNDKRNPYNFNALQIKKLFLIDHIKAFEKYVMVRYLHNKHNNKNKIYVMGKSHIWHKQHNFHFWGRNYCM